jgi:cold shock CspA family protein
LRGTLLRIHPNGYGFIHTESQDYYVNISSMDDRKDWKEQQTVSFLPGQPRKGKATPAYKVRAVNTPNRGR